MKTNCPYCNYLATEHETLDNQKNPKEEDISFCIECGEVSQYSGNCLVKIEVDSLDEPIKKEIKDIEIAWLRTRAIYNLNERGTN